MTGRTFAYTVGWMVLAGMLVIAGVLFWTTYRPNDSAPASSTPIGAGTQRTILDLATGQSPRRVSILIDNSCAVSFPVDDYYRVMCNEATFLVNLKLGIVTPGDPDTKALWDAALRTPTR